MSAISQISIYKPDGTLAVTTTIADSSQRVRNLMAENYIQIDFVSPTYIDIPIGSSISYGGYRFVKARRQMPTYNGAWQYSEQFDDADGFLRARRIKYYGQDFQEMSFALTATLGDFADLIVKDVNKEREGARIQQNWVTGAIDATLATTLKTISFSGDTLFDACTAIAQAFETEWYISKYYVPEGAGHEVIELNFQKRDSGSDIPFEAGTGKILNAMNPQRGEDADYGTRFYVFGGTRNLTEDYKEVPAGSSVPNLYENRLHLPNNQAYIDARNGQIVNNLAHNEVLEQYVTFDDIYPKNRDTITGVDSQIVVDDQSNQYRQYTIQADDCPFAGKGDILDTLGIKFETGELAGQEFEAQLESEELPWNKRLIIVAQNLGTDGQVLYVPNEQLKPSVGDVFVLTGVKLPSSKVADAEDELLDKAEEYAKQHSTDTDVYECISNNVYCYEHPLTQGYGIGTRVKLVNTSIFGANGRSSRIQGVVFALTKPYEITWQVGDNTKYSRFGNVSTTLAEVVYSQRIGVKDNSLLNLIGSEDYQSPSDNNIYTALAAYNHIYKKHDHKGRLIRPAVFCVPTLSPAQVGFSLDDGEVAMYVGSLGSYSETPSGGGGGGSATIYDLIYQKNGTTISTINLGTAQGTINVTISRSDVEDTTHKLATTDQITNWSTAYTRTSVQQGSGLTTDSSGHLELEWQEVATELLGDLGTAAYKDYTTSVTSGSSALITSGAVYTAVNAKYTKPSTGIPKTDLASAVQTTLSNADTAYGWGNHASAGYLTSVAFSDLTSHPTTLSGYGITDAASSSDLADYLGKLANPTASTDANDCAFGILSNVGVASTNFPTSYGVLLAYHGTSNYYKAQIYTTAEGNIYTRIASAVSTWSSWKKLAFSDDLSGYLPLTAGSGNPLTGNLYINTTEPSIYGKVGDNYTRLFGFSASGNMNIFPDSRTLEKDLYISGRVINYSVSTGTDYNISHSNSGFFPYTTNKLDLGTAYRYWRTGYITTLNSTTINATTLKGNLAWSYITSKPTTIAGYGITDAIKTLSYLMPTNPFGGSGRGLQINSLNNGFYGMNKRPNMSVTLTGFNTTNSNALFDANYENHINIAAGGTGVILMECSDNYFTVYAYGYLYVSFYNTAAPSSVSIRAYGTKGGVVGWYDYNTAEEIFDNPSNHCFRAYNGNIYYVKKWEITIVAQSDVDCWVTQVEHQWTRGSQDMMSAVTKFAIKQDLYGDVEAPKFIVRGGTSSQFLKADGSLDSNTYALSSALGSYVPTSRKVNNKALSADITLSLDDVADGSTRKLANYLPLAGGEMTGNITVSAANSKSIGNATNDWQNVYARNFISNDALNLKTTAAKTLTILSAGGVTIQSTANLNIQYKKTGDSSWSSALSANATNGGVGVGNTTYGLTFSGSALTYNIYGAINQRVRYTDTWINVLSTTITSSTAGYMTLGSGAHQTVINGSKTEFRVAGTGKWNINADGHFLPVTTNNVNIGSTSRYVAAGYFIDLNVYTSVIPVTTNTGSVGSSTKRWGSVYSQVVDCSTELIIPTSAPSSPQSGKVYLYSNPTGNYYQS